MRQLHLISAMYSSKGHGREYIEEFCFRLKDNFQITLYLASKIKIDSFSNDINIVTIDVDYEKTNAENFRKYKFFAPYIRSLSKQKKSYNYYKAIVAKQLIKKDSIVYIMDYDVFPLPFLIKGLKKFEVDIYLWIHSAKLDSKDFLYNAYKRIFIYIFNNKILKGVNGVIVNGVKIKTVLENHLDISKDKIHVIQYPSILKYKKIEKKEARKQLKFKKDENIVLFFGLLRRDKNIEKLVRIISKCKSQPKLIIAGAEASITKKEIIGWVEKYNLENFYLDIDYISERKIALYYSCSDLLILTYDLESKSQSGPLSLAREFTLPVIVSNSEEIGYYVKSNNVGVVINSYNDEDFSKEIDSYFINFKENNRYYHQKINIAKEKFSWEVARELYINIFTKQNRNV
ncbi:glycosyltransferase family 4 protein [Aquimarina sp. ERC-38]|uniref:glycosyltransferase family 4 protein n=1 Tax=Aquimarina sp. ERC-38 TaxID=2949996 RepID=UPI0022467273|nr:glycosyltransferase family 4 protein [Aquimarina sp. ERC-38]UZO81858.1 glycosyltransferase family 4 protein [Aquimarina sp. ERC-38]